ncbi:MAG: hypothetical protein IT273_04360 [Chitinophagales bacterium]|nr:hypothetical protein [Chitinophagales bacterium]
MDSKLKNQTNSIDAYLSLSFKTLGLTLFRPFSILTTVAESWVGNFGVDILGAAAAVDGCTGEIGVFALRSFTKFSI